jgi:hypothetical protein
MSENETKEFSVDERLQAVENQALGYMSLIIVI